MASDMLLALPFPSRVTALSVTRSHLLAAPLLQLLSVLWLLIATGCPHSQPPPSNLPLVTTDDREAEAELRQARELHEAGDLDEATSAYQAFLARHPADPLVAIARIALAQIYIADNDGQNAKAVLEPVLQHQDAAVAERARFYQGVALALLADHQAAIAVLAPMVGHTIDPQETGLLLTTLADAYFARGELVGGFRILDHLAVRAVPQLAREAAAARLEAVVNAATPAQIDAAFAALDRGGASWPKVARRALLEADAAHDPARVRDILAAMTELDIELDAQAQEIALRATRPAEADPQVVGAVLTLSGRAREVGEVALRGLMLAAGLPPTGPRAADAPQLVFRDDAGDPARAVQAVDELVTIHRAVAIIGPMDGQAARAAAVRAQELGVPMITLTPQSDIGAVGSLIFRLLASPEEEADALVAHAMRQGKRRFAVLRPDNGYGKLMEGAFQAAIRRQGGELLGAISYPVAATSFGHEIARLAALPFDSLLLADASRKVELIAPALAAGGLWSTLGQTPVPNKARGILLLSPSIGFSPQLVRSVGRYLQGAVFSIPFNAAALNAGERAFTDQYQRQFNAAPDAFAAFAHDAYRLVRHAVDRGARTRADVARALTQLEASDVAGPSRGFSSARAPRTATRLMQVSGTELIGANNTPAQ